MSITRDFKETVNARMQREPEFAKALLDEADYEENSLIMLHKIAIALNQKLTLNFVPLKFENS
jgi:hypothetical protein